MTNFLSGPDLVIDLIHEYAKMTGTVCKARINIKHDLPNNRVITIKGKEGLANPLYTVGYRKLLYELDVFRVESKRSTSVYTLTGENAWFFVKGRINDVIFILLTLIIKEKQNGKINRNS